MKSERLAGALGKNTPKRSRGLQKRIGAINVGFDERTRPVNTAVDVTLGRKMNDRSGLMLRKQSIDQRAIADIALNEDVTGITLKRREVLSVTRIGQRIEINDLLV